MTLEARDRIRAGGLRGSELLAWLHEHPPGDRDAAVERLFGIARPPDALGGAPGVERMPYMPSAITQLVRAVLDVPITQHDVFVDLGAGLGKATMMVHLLTGARARGVEVQPSLASEASAQARELGLDGVSFVPSDALEADLDDATVVFLYLPFTGHVLARVLQRLERVARRRQLVLCALGFDLRLDWIAARPTDEFWLTIYDTRIPGAAPRLVNAPLPFGSLGEAIARER